MATLDIGLPVYNGEKYLGEAIESLRAQTFGDFTLFISDNGSTDRTPDICREHAAADGRIRFTRSDVNRGAAWNFNTVFEAGNADFFKWAAHDDLHDPTYVERCMDVLRREPAVVLCYTGARYIDAEGRSITGDMSNRCHLRQDRPHQRLRGYFGTFPSHVLFGVGRRAALARTRLWGSFASADRVLVSEIALQGQVHEIAEPLFIRRLHPDISWTMATTDKEYALWYDPANRDKVPLLRRAVEYVRGVGHAGLPLPDRLGSYAEVARYAVWDRGFRKLPRYAAKLAARAGR
ncbi:glycosyltransferase [Sphingomonas sp. BN140010]|uniref:Glycosyltransferase n=1 Tax=Sphingomonas arvum TaxID=2992113 RepID=A0ABT3JDI3_9SPHN|nr:glycosyltransferase [Sphingomonas sp. BN140010]MCW3797127.1 glycosyltransferase [Sphingomonas sp. BN140010]